MEEFQVVFYYQRDKDKEPEKVCYFKCRAFSEMIRALYFCKKYEVVFWVRDDDEKITNQDIIDNINTCGAIIDDFNVSFGSDDCIQIIEIYLK